MAESLFIKVDEVGELLGISRAEAYRIIKKLNSELAEKGYIVISGRVSRRYCSYQNHTGPSDVWRKNGL